jgi:hypothetical protein
LVWNPLIDLSERIETLFDKHLVQYPIEEPIGFAGWKDTYWKSDHVRKCHLKTIDNRSTQKLWLMHINIFPKVTSNLPILGFDIVSGPNKITGSFFDFSPVCDSHEYHDHFDKCVKELEWNKPRDLPEWAKAIFSKNMIAVGNIKSEKEIRQLSDACFSLIEFYLTQIKKFEVNAGDFKLQQNFYCKQQKLNPHLHRSILAMGISEEDKNRYIDKVLFEEV